MRALIFQVVAASVVAIHLHAAKPMDPPWRSEETPTATLARAEAALAAGFPRAVLPDLRSLVEQRDLDVALRGRALDRTAEALILAGQPAEALEILDKNSTLSPRSEFWRAQAFLAAGNPASALAAYEHAINLPEAPLRAEATLGAARAAAATGDTAKALSYFSQIPKDSPISTVAGLDHAELLLELKRPIEAGQILDALPNIPPSLQPRFSVLRAHERLQRGDASGALILLERLEERNPSLAETIVCMRARCLRELGRNEEAITLLEDYLRESTGNAPRLAALETLDSLRTETGSFSTAELRRLYSDTKNPARALDAAFYLAKAEASAASPAVAIQILQDMTTRAPQHPLAPRARLQGAELLLDDSRFDEALAILEPLDSGAAWMLRGLILAQKGDLAAAENAFVKAASDPSLAEDATYNAALCLLLRGVPSNQNPHAATLASRAEWKNLAQRFALDSAIFAARERRPEAGRLFEDLIPIFPVAAVKLAEWRYLQVDLDGAREALSQFPDAENDDDASALAVFLADDGSERGRETAIARALEHRMRFPNSARRREVSFKLADLYFREGNYLGARGLLEEIAATETDPNTIAAAWFLAGQASSKLLTPEAREQAMLAYEEAAKAGGFIAARARFEQALLLAADNQSDAALVLLDRVLASSPSDDLRAAALLTRGDIFFARGAETQNAYLEAAKVWNELADSPGISSNIANEARTKAGIALEKSGRRAEAIQCLYRVFLNAEPVSEDDFWFYKAGFDAARLLEEDKAWKEAIAVYERLAQCGGTRAEEARAKANRLRLENFLWED